MFPAFTGTSRKPRQVNLSGKVTNPFTSTPGPSSPAPAAPSQTTLAAAQFERLQRRQERERLNGVKLVQRLWRGQTDRWRARHDWRSRWDSIGDRSGEVTSEVQDWRGQDEDPRPFEDEAELTEELRLVLYFANVDEESDVQRILWTCGRLRATNTAWLAPPTQATSYLLRRYQNLCLRALERSIHHGSLSATSIYNLLASVTLLTRLIGKDVRFNADLYYKTLSTVLRNRDDFEDLVDDIILSAAAAPLETISAASIDVYRSFALEFLTTPSLATSFYKEDSLSRLLSLVNYKILAAAILQDLDGPGQRYIVALPLRSRAWLLAYFIDIYDQAFAQHKFVMPPEDYISVVSTLLGTLDRALLSSIEIPMTSPDRRRLGTSLSNNEHSAVPPYIHEKISSLVDRQSIIGLLRLINKLDPVQEGSPATPLPAYSSRGGPSAAELDSILSTDTAELARITAEYILGLIRFFPNRADDIRMWIHLGAGTDSQSTRRPTAVQYFFQASRQTRAYQAIKLDPRAFVKFVNGDQRSSVQTSPGEEFDWRREWCITLLFLQLYSFVLRVTDDEEFFGSQDVEKSFSLVKRTSSLVTDRSENRLQLNDVRDLIVFLKNLAFALYYYQADLVGTRNASATSGMGALIHSLPGFSSSLRDSNPKDTLAQLDAISAGASRVDYVDDMKGLVTGLLRSLYERDSRRSFLPKDAWLMTKYFDMDKFIPDVVAEEEQRHLISEEDTDGVEANGVNSLSYSEIDLVGTAHTQQQRRLDATKKNQQETSRQRRLEAIAPRLEIMQNMPFFIPFETRVQIFRWFVYLDQRRRRGGLVDSQQWRLWVVESMSIVHPSQNEVLRRQSATIRRGTLLEDAFEQFWKLGDGLKEPISISFIDVHGVEEEGIDGGGVTKEFLTSVTNEAFNPDYGLHMFNETAKNLLYPNPTVIDERTTSLEDIGFIKGSTDFNEGMRVLLQRYEFLGRIVGKCLYEGILVDLSFAPFFLLKWSLTGGRNSASRENGFRASINDLKDLDEDLYQGLLRLKTYTGSVEDLGLTFSVDDQVEVDGRMVTVTHDLGKGLGKTPVTNENRLVYISLLSKYRLVEQQKKQTEAFLRGLSSIIQPMWLSLFNQSELQTLVGGSERPIDIEDLRKHTSYGGLYAIGDDGLEHTSVQLFWDVIRGMSEEDKRQVLKFVTSTPRAPLLGFSQLTPAFSIRDGGSDEQRLPTASTCVNLLKLPRYSSASTLKRKLLDAVNSGAGFGFS